MGMEILSTMITNIFALALVSTGWVLCYLWMTFSRHGTLYFDTSNPDKDSYLLDLDIDLEEIPDHKWLILNVRNKNSVLSETVNKPKKGESDGSYI